MAGWSEEFGPTHDILIGRSVDANVRLHPTEDTMVGRKHARLFCRNEHWYIETLHKRGVLLRGKSITSITRVYDGDIYMLGRDGPEFRVSLLSDEVPSTINGTRDSGARAWHEALGRQPPHPPLRRVEFNPAEIEVSVKQESRRALRIPLASILLLIVLTSLGFFWFLPRDDPAAMSGPDIQQNYHGSVFRAASTVRFRGLDPDVQQTEWARYWIIQGTSFAVGKQDGWVYALTNHHVFGQPSRPDLSTDRAREHLIRRAILERWPRDWPGVSEKLSDFEVRQNAIDVTDVEARTKIRMERYDYIGHILAQCEIDTNDDQWRQVIVDGKFVPVEVVDSAAKLDLVLFRFREPARSVEPLPLRCLIQDDQENLAGRPVHILGFPAVGDLPLKCSADAIASHPDIASGVLSNIKPDDRHSGFSIQVTAPVNEGHSGGPLFDAWGNVIGINTWGPSKMEAEGVSYSLALGPALEMLHKHDIVWRQARPPE